MTFETQSNNKKIAKNSILLYVRMGFLMVVSLFTSRVILDTLGVDDFGIFTVVGGVVSMFTILSGSLTSAIMRFMTYELGKDNIERLKLVFSTSVNIQIGISIIIFVAAEIIGLWFLNSKMNIPDGRMEAANIVLHASLGIFVLNLLSVPYNAAIIAHERMGAYAYISILDILAKLAVAYCIVLSPVDRLSTYAFLLLIEALVIRLIYGIYSKRQFVECTYHFVHNHSIFKEMTKFAGWNFLGVGAYTLNTQGVNVLMNIYFNVSVNAARGIAVQAGNAIVQFVNSFTTAVNPQITKSYATGNMDYLYSLICRSAKFSTYLFLFIAIPLTIETPAIFRLWLNTVPDYTVLFFRLSVLGILMDNVLANPIMTAVFATGDIRKYQVYVTLLGVLVFPLTWISYLLGASPEWTYIIYFVVYCIVLYVRLSVLRDKIGLPIARFIREVLLKIVPVTILSFVISSLFVLLLPSSFIRIMISTVFSLVISSCIIYLIGLSVGERQLIVNKGEVIRKRILKK